MGARAKHENGESTGRPTLEQLEPRLLLSCSSPYTASAVPPMLKPLEPRLLLSGMPSLSEMVVFGDSLSDTGNVAAGVWDYLIHFELSDGRFTSSPESEPPSTGEGVWHETLADKLGMGPIGYSEDGGQNFANGGATTGDGTRKLGFVDNVGQQISDYLLQPLDGSSVLYVVWAGGNDLIDAADEIDSIYNTRELVDQEALVPTAIAAVANLKGHILDIIDDAEAQYILWPNLPALSDVPHTRELHWLNDNYGLPLTTGAYTDATKAALSYAVQTFNNRWELAIEWIEGERNVTFYDFDVHALFGRMLAGTYGDFANTEDKASEHDDLTPEETDGYLFWDGMHPTAKAHELLGDEAYAFLTSESSSPQVDSFFYTGNPYPVIQRGQLLLSASASDPDGSVEHVEFYRDANGNGVLETGVDEDEYVGSDFSPQGGQWDWYGEARWNQGTHRFFARARDNEGLWSSPSSILVSIGSSPRQQGYDLEFYDTNTHDDDGDGVDEGREHVDLTIKLKNIGSVRLTSVTGSLSSSVSQLDISPASPQVCQWPQIDPENKEWNYGDWDLLLNLDEYDDLPLSLHMTYEKDDVPYYQDFTFQMDIEVQSDPFFAISGFALDDSTDYSDDNDGDGVLESGEDIRIRPRVCNNGQVWGTDVELMLLYDGDVFQLGSGGEETESYPDLGPGDCDYPLYDSTYSLGDIRQDFTGWVCLDADFRCDQVDQPMTEDALCIYVSPAPWIHLSEDAWDFGVVAPGDPVTYTLTISNSGTAPMDVTGFNISHPGDTTVGATGLPWTLQPGESGDVLITIDTANIESGTRIERTITAISPDGRYDDPEDIQLAITGLVSNEVPICSVPELVGADNPDVSSGWIVYQNGRNGNADIFAYNIQTGEELQVTDDPADQHNPRIAGDLVVWEDWRNDDGSLSNGDIYAYDMSTGQEFPVSTDPANEFLIGLDTGMVAFAREYHVFTETTNWQANNLYVVECTGEGACSPVFTTGFTATPGHDPKQSVGDGDFGGRFLVFERHEVYWEDNIHGGSWRSQDQHLEKIDFALGETTATRIVDPCRYPNEYSATDNGFFYEKSGWDDELWIWDNGTNRAIAFEEDKDIPVDVLAGNRDFVVFDRQGSGDVLYYKDDINVPNKDELLTRQVTNPGDMRIDGNVVVWKGKDAESEPRVFFALLNCPDIAVASANLVFSDDAPHEGDVIDVSILVRNVTDYEMTDDITVRLYDGDPDAGGIELVIPDNPPDYPRVIPGLAGQGQTTVTFTAITVPQNIGPDDPGPHDIYARIAVAGLDNPCNNTASKVLDVYDDDTEGPVISNVVVAEYNGDGDGIIGADEQLQISWALTDPSGIGSTRLWVDRDRDGLGEPGNRDPDDAVEPLDGDYYAILEPLDADGFGALQYGYAIDATDADNNPASSHYLDSFDVVLAEEITVLYNGQPIVDGETVPIDFGQVTQGSPSVIKIFHIRNDGQQDLSLGAIDVPDGFTATGPDSTVIGEGESTYFVVILLTDELGSFGGDGSDVSLANTDGPRSPDGLDEHDFTFAVTGCVCLAGDLDCDGFVGGEDLNIVLGAWGDSVTAGDWLAGDPSGDGFVGGEDLNTVLTNWGDGVVPGAPSGADEATQTAGQVIIPVDQAEVLATPSLVASVEPAATAAASSVQPAVVEASWLPGSIALVDVAALPVVTGQPGSVQSALPGIRVVVPDALAAAASLETDLDTGLADVLTGPLA